jgi:uncharacterized protein YndB with AHSA1/START domain
VVGILQDREGTIHNQIIAFEPGRMIAFRVQKPPKGFPFQSAYTSTWSVVTLTGLGDGRTHLRLAGLGYTADEESQPMRRFFDTGNAWSLKRLQSHFDASLPVGATAAAHTEPPLAPVDLEALIPGAREDVYRAYATADGWKSFLGIEARVQAVPGGSFEILFRPDAPPGERGSEGCTVLALVPGEMFSHTWNAPPRLPYAREHPTWVVVTFDAVAAKITRVRLRHLGFAERAAGAPDHAAEFQEARAHFQGAWPRVLTALCERFEAALTPPAAPRGK